MELALQEAVDNDKLRMPLVVVDFSQWSPTGDVEADKSANRLIEAVGKITSLQVPHRLADAILRDSQTPDGVEFRKSEKGKALNTANPQNATPLYQLCPTALVFGMWDSTVPKGGLGAKFERAVVSEIIGVGAEVGDLLRGVRRDPLEIRSAVKVLKAADGNWSIAPAGSKNAVAPSEINHSSVPFPKQRDRKTEENKYAGVTIEYAEQVTTLSLIVLRRLRFPANGTPNPETDVAGRTVLAALGLCAATLAFENGMGLRSRCLLWPEGPMQWELLDKPGENPKAFTLTGDAAVSLFKAAVGKAKEAGLTWEETPIMLMPQPKLVDLVRRSQNEPTKESNEGGD
jgi:CRISPR-associated protein Csb1